MKKISWATHKSLFGQIAASTCLVAASAGIIFGVSAGTFKIQYMNLDSGQARLESAISHNYFSQNISSQWNMYQKGEEGKQGYVKGVDQPETNVVEDAWWEKVHPGTTRLDKKYNDIDPDKMNRTAESGTEITDKNVLAEREKYGALVIDGATHTALDRSFNQGLYNGIVNFIRNIQKDISDASIGQIYKPSQDSTQEFVNIYRAVAAKTRMLCLAGFNHVTPLNALGKQTEDGLYEFSDKNIANTGMMLMDGDISNNQNIASVLFRSDQPAFLTALATCMYFYNNIELYHSGFNDLKVAAYGGTAIPTVIVYMGGFQRGVEFFNQFVLKDSILGVDAYNYIINSEVKRRSEIFETKLLPNSKYKDEVEAIKAKQEKKKEEIQAVLDKLYEEYSIKMIKLGDFGTHFSGSFAAGDAIGISKQLLNRGASAIIAVAGPQSLDTAQEVMNQNSNCIVIGVDSAMERSDYQKPFKNKAFEDKTVAADGTVSAQASNIIKFSAVKDMTNVSDKMMRLAINGKHWDVDNDKPWLSKKNIPSWTKEEEYPVDRLNITLTPPVAPATEGTYEVNGFSEQVSLNNPHVLNLPLLYTKNGTSYRLKKIAGVTFTKQTPFANKIDTLKISGTFGKNQTITLGEYDEEQKTVLKPAFDYSQWEGAAAERPGFKYIDFTDIPANKIVIKSDRVPIFKEMLEGDTGLAYRKGVMKFNITDTDADKENLCKSLFRHVGTKVGEKPEAKWLSPEPDPYRSICSVGFKTCGNIENGLISISWDGWPLLLQALNHIHMTPVGGVAIPFIDCWNNAAGEYIKINGASLPKEFKDYFINPRTYKELSTFNKDSIINKYYSHIMAVLGLLLKTCTVSFPIGTTILIDNDGKPYLPDDIVGMTILDWLKYNMYFTL